MAIRKNKNNEPLLITISELARQAGVSRAAASAWLKRQEAQGIELIHADGRRRKLVDINNPLVKNYINNITEKSKRNEKQAETVPAMSLKKMQYHAEKLKLENKIMRSKYIETEIVLNTISKYIEYEEKLYKDFANHLLYRIENELNIKIAHNDRNESEKIINDALAKAHNYSIRILSDFKKEYIKGESCEK